MRVIHSQKLAQKCTNLSEKRAREVRNPIHCRIASENTTEECELNEKITRCVISGAIRVAIAPRELARSSRNQ
jgi:hypothetical protein